MKKMAILYLILSWSLVFGVVYALNHEAETHTHTEQFMIRDLIDDNTIYKASNEHGTIEFPAGSIQDMQVGTNYTGYTVDITFDDGNHIQNVKLSTFQ